MQHGFRLSERASLDERLRRAHTRNTGTRATDVVVTELRPHLSRTSSPETGAWCEFDTSAWRIRKVAQGDDANSAPTKTDHADTSV